MSKELKAEIKRLVKDLSWGKSMELENLLNRAYAEGYADATHDAKYSFDSVMGSASRGE